MSSIVFFFFQAEDGIRDCLLSRGLGDVYKRQDYRGITQGLLPGANGGINFRYMEENHFGFIVELNFEQRGWKEDFEKRPFSYSLP